MSVHNWHASGCLLVSSSVNLFRNVILFLTENQWIIVDVAAKRKNSPAGLTARL